MKKQVILLYSSIRKQSNLVKNNDMNIYPMFDKKENNTLRNVGLLLLGVTICVYLVLVVKFLF